MLRLAIAALLAATPAAALAQDAAPAESALSAPFIGNDGKPVGLANLTDTPNGVLLVATFEPGMLSAGEHAIHFHETGDCSDTAKFEKAGAHHDPGGHEHGYKSEAGPHAGDLPNFVITEGQQMQVSHFSATVRFGEGDAPLFDADGSAIVIHAGPDDYETQPSGGSGDRIACAALTGN